MSELGTSWGGKSRRNPENFTEDLSYPGRNRLFCPLQTARKGVADAGTHELRLRNLRLALMPNSRFPLEDFFISSIELGIV